MDLKQLEYIVKIAEEKNITHAADKLYLTQSALNQQLLKLEKDLGTQLFHRSRTDWKPTEAGEVYIQTAKEMLSMKQEAYNRIYDLSNIQKGKLSIGFTPNRGIAMFSDVYPKFHRTHYGILIEPMELSVQTQQFMISSGQLDIGFMTLQEKNRKPSHNYVELAKEEIFLAVPRRHPVCAYAAGKNKPFTMLDTEITELIKEEPFVLIHGASTLRELIDNAFVNAGFRPHILFETSNTNAIVTMIRSEMCCGILPAFYVQPDQDEICYFSLPSRPSWDIVASYKKSSYISKAAKDFISLAANYWKTQNIQT